MKKKGENGWKIHAVLNKVLTLPITFLGLSNTCMQSFIVIILTV